MKWICRSFIVPALLPLIIILWIYPAWGVELSIPEVTIESGKTAEFPVIIDRIDNLAGVKLVMSYDKELLTYKKGVRGEKANSLMHVVNNKNPGRLIIVMAGARGIKGKKFPILILTFESKSGLKTAQNTMIAIEEFQLMGDDLKEIKCEIRTEPINITPAAAKTE